MPNFDCWLQSSLERVYPRSRPRPGTSLDMLAARNERLSFQTCVHNATVQAPLVRVEVADPLDLEVQVRRVGCVPIPHHSADTPEQEIEGMEHVPGYVPDPLFPEQEGRIGPYETMAFWVTVTVPDDVRPGPRQLVVRWTVEDEAPVEMPVQVDVRPFTNRPLDGFPVMHWFYADALCDWYGVEPFEDRFWDIVKPYMRNLVTHGNNCQYVPVFTPPTDGVKRPTQLLGVRETEPGTYEFDWSDVRRWTKLAQECGAQSFEWTHLFWQWGVKHALRIYRSNRDPESLLWPPETGATSDVYRNFLAQFLPRFREFLEAEDLLERSYFHLSDEPHGDEHVENYRQARAMLRELAPWMKVADALSDIRFGLEGLTDYPIPVLSAAKEFLDAGIPAWTYYCCGPRGEYTNRLIDTPLVKIRMTGWLFHRLRAGGFLHWGYNYWYKSQTQQMIDPFTELGGGMWPGWASGDPFVVYPGANGPIDALRWEVFAESLQDLALLRTAGIDPDDPLLNGLDGYDRFPRDENWIRQARAQLLNQ